MFKLAPAFPVVSTLLFSLFFPVKVLSQGCGGPVPPNIVFTSAPRDVSPHPFYDDRSHLQRFSDVAFINRLLNETDLVMLDAGTRKTIYNCTGNQTIDCSAQEARVSPDATKIVFSVTFNGSTHAGATSAKLFLYDIATAEVIQIPNQSATVINRMPDWIDNATLVYSSNAANLYPVRDQYNCHEGTYNDGSPRAIFGNCISQTYEYGHAGKAMQIWRMKIDGTEQRNLTPHESNAIRPTVLRHPNNQGRIAYSSFQANEDEAYYRASSAPSTIANLWWIMTMKADGTQPFALAGAHHDPVINKGVSAPLDNNEEFMALRAVGEDTEGNIFFTNYYRGNHMGGLGSIYRTTPQLGRFDIEGCSTEQCFGAGFQDSRSHLPGTGQFMPSNLTPITPFGVGEDLNQNVDAQGRATGKAGYPSYRSNGNLLATWGQGWCYNQLPFGDSPFDGTSASIGGEPMCDLQIVELLQQPVINPHNPNQMRVLVGDTSRHDFDATEIAVREEVSLPAPLPSAEGCHLQVVDLRAAELYPKNPTYDWRDRAELVAIQGNSVKPHDPSFHAANVQSLAIYGVQMHTTTYPSTTFVNAVNYTGYEDMWLLGTQDMLADGSVRVKVPCDQPLMMSALDAEGRAITHDAMLTSLRPGETRTCHGCHEGHSIERAYAMGFVTPEDAFANTLAALTSPTELSGQERITFTDVEPILISACGGCHSEFHNNDGLLWSKVFADNAQLDFPWMTKVQSRNGDNLLPRPYFSGLVARYARWSPLVWVMTGSRLDGYQNADYTVDQDYPTDHPPVNITSAQIEAVVDYIQLGAPRN